MRPLGRRGQLPLQPRRLLGAEPPDVAAAAGQLDRVEHDQLPGAEPQRVVAALAGRAAAASAPCRRAGRPRSLGRSSSRGCRPRGRPACGRGPRSGGGPPTAPRCRPCPRTARRRSRRRPGRSGRAGSLSPSCSARLVSRLRARDARCHVRVGEVQDAELPRRRPPWASAAPGVPPAPRRRRRRRRRRGSGGGWSCEDAWRHGTSGPAAVRGSFPVLGVRLTVSRTRPLPGQPPACAPGVTAGRRPGRARRIPSAMVVLGIDPGTANTGYGVVARHGARLRRARRRRDRDGRGAGPRRAAGRRSTRAWAALLDDYRPDALAVEDLYFGANARSAFAVGQARGVVILAAGQRGSACCSYTPQQVKGAVCGSGRADKGQVQRMVQSAAGADRPAAPGPRGRRARGRDLPRERRAAARGRACGRAA